LTEEGNEDSDPGGKHRTITFFKRLISMRATKGILALDSQTGELWEGRLFSCVGVVRR